ncbi:putative zinc-binding metallopeptidase [Ponticaulis sp.]|uniref:zinc-binding metallopeptidase family protein n=1 Tax=Ponticaulis sp. TaxID=2020902 RepID=UPI000B64838F|nr:putative zinc-binding metallopeptidase [Ponticaulis sp.]MAI90388.1 hypothetical protein [Ponticaulis sp.]OUY00091.1 MAG: hypothetical protein CBB65_08110 [Hyphomonadaceae bacterium TMED5]|tara:strand:+ start:2100 stop:3116 length:1017 start_codon:yes stop_codon:yes gene_type:complete
MQIFHCAQCGQQAFFSNLTCNCGAELVFDPEPQKFVSGAKFCANRQVIGCNWKAENEAGYCRSCAMTTTIPDTFRNKNVRLWQDAEKAKRWVLANLGRWGWFTNADQGARPTFNLLSEKTSAGRVPVVMGHADGEITINVMESDPVERERRRDELSERLRTMTAHFRHEIAHFLFLRLSSDERFLNAFRARFGDERADYGAALDRHYAEGAPADFQQNYVTRYASSHPHEDWAETAAHAMHLTDIVDSAVSARLTHNGVPSAKFDAYRETNSVALLRQAFEIGTSLNHVNRSMGMQDIYPFVISQNVHAKLVFVHEQLIFGAGIKRKAARGWFSRRKH